jgi:hypothetical protein
MAIKNITKDFKMKNKKFPKMLVVIFLLATVVAGAFHINNRNNGKPQKASITPENETVSPEPDEDIDGLKETVNFPLNITEAKDADKYRIFVKKQIFRDNKKHIVKGKLSKTITKYKKLTGLNITAYCPEGPDKSLRLKIYKGTAPQGQYKLIYDRISKTKTKTKQSRQSYQYRHLLTLPKSYKNASNIVKKRVMESRKAEYDRKMLRVRKTLRSFPNTSFQYTNKNDAIDLKNKTIYIRIFLCDTEGRVIKESTPHRIKLQSSYSRYYNNNYITDAYQYKMDEDSIFPYFGSNRFKLVFYFREKNAFEIISMKIDGVEYPPNLIYRDRPTVLSFPVFKYEDRFKKQSERKPSVKKKQFQSLLTFDYPFGGNVILRFKVKDSSGKYKICSYNFCLPFPAPIPYKKFSDGKVSICWDGIDKYFSEKNYTRRPILVLLQRNVKVKEFESLKTGEYEVKDLFGGESATYNFSLNGGEMNNNKWTSKKGIQKCKITFVKLNSGINNVEIIVPDINKKRSIRLEIVKSNLVFENTGIPAMKLLNKIIKRVENEKSILTYDADGRDYVIGEKLFAMAGDLRRKFALRESDFSFQLRDYSRADGKGIELWLFKRKIEHGGRPGNSYMNRKPFLKNKLSMMGYRNYYKGNTKFWKIASFKLGSSELEFDKIADLLVKSIKDKADFYISPDIRAKKIKPRKIICKDFRPANQAKVIWNYKAISETFALKLGENSKNIKILSKEDWDLVINERLNANHKGYDIIDNNDREVLLTGRMWRDGKKKSFFIKACDAFSGEILGAKIFTGKISEIAKEVSQWSKIFRVADDIKVDFQSSLFMSESSKKYRIPWRIKTDYLARHGLVFKSPINKFKRTHVRRDFSPLAFARRQWKDGFRNKAIKVFEGAWKREKKFSYGTTLLSYYSTMKLKHKGFALCNELIKIDDCPEIVLTYYQEFKDMKLISTAEDPDSSRANKVKKEKLIVVQWGRVKGWTNSRFDEMFYVDRDFISPEWCPDGKYRTILLSMKLNTNARKIAKYILSPLVINNGIFYNIKAFGLRSGNSYKITKDQSTIVSLAGWNSVTPFSEDIPKELLYTRTANLFPSKFSSGLVEKLYMVSTVRVIMELKENLKLPILNYDDYKTDKKFKDGYSYLKRLVGEAEEAIRKNGSIRLSQYLAIDTLAKVYDKDALELYSKIIDGSYEKLKMKAPHNTGDFAVFRAFKGDEQAQKYLSEHSVHLKYYYGRDDAQGFDKIFPLLKKLESDILIKIVLKNGGKRGLYALRWASKETFKNILLKHSNLLPGKVARYLIMGARNDEAAWKWLGKDSLMQYLGKPEDEFYAAYQQRHFDRVAKLKAEKKSEEK